MSKRQKHALHKAPAASQAESAPPAVHAKAEVFSFGDPTPVLDRRELLDYVESWQNGRWYEPPIPLDGLARAFRAAPYHASAIYVKRNILTSTFIPSTKLSRRDFAALALDYLTLANCYLRRIRAVSGRPIRYQREMAKYVRRGVKDLDQYFFVHGWAEETPFDSGSVYQLMEPDISQEIYGVPEYMSALQSTLLNEAATLFRRKYYVNGSHAGFILYMNDAAQKEEDITALRTALRESKGPGNFRNLFVYSPNGKKDGLQMIPVGEVAAKDEFIGIKTASRDDILGAHRVPPQLIGVIPTGTSGFGDVIKATDVFVTNEVVPLQNRFREINEWAGEELIRFAPYKIVQTDPTTS